MLAAGRSSYTLADPRPGSPRTITVHVYRPSSFTPDTPILMVMHGVKRNGDEYCDYFAAEAERLGFLVVAPTFSVEDYPQTHSYNYGAMIDAQGKPQPREQWLFPVLQRVFEDVRARTGSRREKFFLFGHSAGSQFVHRLVTFGWLDSIERAIAANAGSYTLPSREEAFPFGIDGIPIETEELARAFARPLTIFLGDQDVDENDEHLPREPGAMKQGPYRFARGQNYFQTAKREAARLGTTFAWRLAIAPGVAHSGQNMAPFAARELFEHRGG